MKILFPFVGDSVGGSHLSSLNLCKTLKANNYDVVILLHNINGPLSKLLNEMEIKYQEAIKTIIGKDYPKPIVIHEEARAAALKAFQSLKN